MADGGHGVELLSAGRTGAGRDDAPEPAAFGERRPDEVGGIALHRGAEIPDLEPEAQIRLVDAIALHRLAVLEPAERAVDRARRPRPTGPPARSRCTPCTSSCADERRLDVDLGEFGLPVGPQVLVAKAARDLEVAVVARHHQQLLVDLGRLGQRVELAPMHPTGHQVVARAFRRRLGEDRGLDLQELQLAEGPPGALQQPVAEHADCAATPGGEGPGPDA